MAFPIISSEDCWKDIDSRMVDPIIEEQQIHSGAINCTSELTLIDDIDKNGYVVHEEEEIVQPGGINDKSQYFVDIENIVHMRMMKLSRTMSSINLSSAMKSGKSLMTLMLIIINRFKTKGRPKVASRQKYSIEMSMNEKKKKGCGYCRGKGHNKTGCQQRKRDELQGSNNTFNSQVLGDQ